MKNENDMEDLFKKSFDNYEPEVRPKVWENVKVGLKWGSLGMLINALMNKIGTTTLIAVVTSAIAVIGTIAVVNMNKENKQQTAVDNNSAPTPTIPVADSNHNATGPENETTPSIEVAPATASNISETKPTVVVDESVATISANLLTGTAPLIVDLSNAGTGKTNKWLFSDSKKENTATTAVHVFENPGKYTVKLISTDANGKQDVDTASIEVIESVATIYKFSPDGDGTSDTLKLNPKGIASLDAKIYDKDGNLVFKSEGQTAANWDGKNIQGKESPKGNYYLMIKATTPKGKQIEQKGIVQLIK